MKSLCVTGRALRAGLMTALVCAVASLAGAASAGDFGPGPGPGPGPFIPATPIGSYGLCTMSGPGVTGRTWAALMPGRGEYCIRQRLGGDAPPGATRCGELASSIGCVVVN